MSPYLHPFFNFADIVEKSFFKTPPPFNNRSATPLPLSFYRTCPQNTIIFQQFTKTLRLHHSEQNRKI